MNKTFLFDDSFTRASGKFNDTSNYNHKADDSTNYNSSNKKKNNNTTAGLHHENAGN